MANTFKEGDKVEWQSIHGPVQGTIEKMLTAPMDIKGHHVDASPDEPHYLVSSAKTGVEAAHKPTELKKLH